MFSDRGPSLTELAVQALSSVEHGYDLLAPKFDATPFRTPEPFLDAVVSAVEPLGPFRRGLDVCCGTGAGVRALRRVCEEGVTGFDFSPGMLAEAHRAFASGEGEGPPAVEWVRADARALPFDGGFDLATSFGAFGHFLPEERPAVFAGVRAALRPGGVFAFPLPAPSPVGSLPYWAMWGFDAAMRVRNAVWRPPFVMYYRTFGLGDALRELADAGFSVELVPAESFGRRPDGSPRCVTVVARGA
ncbi:class I SAM-dependent methyltransferase [Streptomyces sp. 8L]|uniref:class I SAM-dependent methyltransferase n=1 Tax=Streptomyces sp. 8L TaxID=2877242 RepID=UPI001CD4C53D|nr:class I SAM-dependent methyltransferase [Streptomyces sp. 8L]MCA1217446.1 class I SAM-dependent methyltransferase [Streptomyces sp. 8L]